MGMANHGCNPWSGRSFLCSSNRWNTDRCEHKVVIDLDFRFGAWIQRGLDLLTLCFAVGCVVFPSQIAAYFDRSWGRQKLRRLGSPDRIVWRLFGILVAVMVILSMFRKP
jgi:hypothetical protein